MKTITSLSLALGLVLTAQAQTIQYDLNNTSDITTEFTTTDGAGPGYTGVDGIGLSGSAGLLGGLFSTNTSGSVPNVGPYSFSTLADFSVTQSIYFRTQSGGGAGGATFDNTDALILGLTPNSSVTPGFAYQSFATDGFAIAARVTDADVDDLGTQSVIQFQGFDDVNNAFFGFGGNTTLSLANEWYLYEVEFAYDSLNNDWDITWSIYESDSNGVINPAAIGTLSATRINPFTITDDTMELSGFFGSSQSRRGNIFGFDQLTVVAVPEPTTFAQMAGLFGLLAYLRKKKV